uniref:DUF4212 domain-containing protein n=1 Tax=Angiostrongylus cantonensis TaxID=6313 RepID=A0A0K0DCU7_ANGCA
MEFVDLKTNTTTIYSERVAQWLEVLQTFLIVSFLALFSLIYLIYAQHHKILFYVMTRYVVSGFPLWIVLVYAAGVFSVLYMIIVDYDNKAQDEKDNKDNDAQQESSM